MNPALYKGNFIHSVIEHNYDYETEFKTNDIFTPEKKELAKEIIKKFEESDLGKLYKSKVEDDEIYSQHEEKFGIKVQDGKVILCDYWDKECWIRGALDFQYTEDGIVYNIDWKSGKDKSDDDDFGITQSMAYSIFLMLKFPNIDTFISKFVFVEHGTEKEIVYTRNKFNEYVKYFYDLTKTVENDEFYPEKTSALCDWCDFQKFGHCTAVKDLEEISKSVMKEKVSLDF
jgi:CRISPR/Cas system-associated exonuclease Cas4 (RecB family)